MTEQTERSAERPATVPRIEGVIRAAAGARAAQPGAERVAAEDVERAVRRAVERSILAPPFMFEVLASLARCGSIEARPWPEGTVSAATEHSLSARDTPRDNVLDSTTSRRVEALFYACWRDHSVLADFACESMANALFARSRSTRAPWLRRVAGGEDAAVAAAFGSLRSDTRRPPALADWARVALDETLRPITASSLASSVADLPDSNAFGELGSMWLERVGVYLLARTFGAARPFALRALVVRYGFERAPAPLLRLPSPCAFDYLMERLRARHLEGVT